MEKRKIETAITLLTLEDKPFNFHNIENNTAAQEWLKIAAREMSADKVFEEVYQIQQDYGKEMQRRRALRREKGPQQEPSLIDPKMEEMYYDNDARETTMKAMLWLKKQGSTRPDN